MSIKALNWVLEDESIPESNDRFVLLILANYADENGNCYPSRDNIAKKTRISVRSVQRSLNWLTDNGYITKEKRFFDGKQSSNYYTLDFLGRGDTVALGSLQSDTVALGQGDTVAHYTKEVKESYTKEKEDICRVVFNSWSQVLNHPRAKFDRKRQTRIAARLNEGFTVDDLKQVPYGVLKSKWHIGDNPQKQKYDAIDIVYRDAAQVEKFLELARNGHSTDSPGCDMCRNDPNRHFVTLKTFGWIFDPNSGKINPCICKTNGTA
jgi:DNA-binding transcriptional ArsR family regulator